MAHDDYAHVSEFYDAVPLYRDRPDIAFYVVAAKSAGGPVLEVGCGTGRVLIPTAREGIPAVGIDASPRMLGICRSRLEQECADVRSRVRLVEADMRHFDVDGRFPLAIIPFRPFQHLLTVHDQLACLTTIHRHLADDGRLMFDMFNPSLDMLVNTPIGQEFGWESEFTMDDGRRVVRCMKVVTRDRFSQVDQHELIYSVTHPDGRAERIVHAFSLRHVFRYEAEHLLVRAGFDVEQVYGDFERTPYGATPYPGELIFVARKSPERRS